MIDEELIQPSHPPYCPQCGKPTEKNRPFCDRCRFDLRYGSPKPVTSGFCIYCNKYGKLSDEHIFPRWLRKVYPRRHKKTTHQLIRPERHLFWDVVPVHGECYDRSGDPYTTVVQNVCEQCNNGWMSALQDDAKPLVKNLADGRWPDLSDTEIKLLVRWAAMVSINLECLSRMLITPPGQRTELMEGSIPPGWRTYIGSMKNADCAGESFHRSIAVPISIGEYGEHLRLQSTYFCIESVSFYTLRSLGDITLEGGLIAVGLSEMRIPMRALWPVKLLEDKSKGVGLRREDLVDIQRQFGDVEQF